MAFCEPIIIIRWKIAGRRGGAFETQGFRGKKDFWAAVRPFDRVSFPFCFSGRPRRGDGDSDPPHQQCDRLPFPLPYLRRPAAGRSGPEGGLCGEGPEGETTGPCG